MLPSFAAYCPAAQASHLTALGVDEDRPAGHILQVLVELSAYVPGKQLPQKPANDFAQDSRSPAGHFAHTTQLVCFDAFWYLLASQSVHDATLDTVEYLPAAHSLHVLGPTSVPEFVIDPTPHRVHDVLPALPE